MFVILYNVCALTMHNHYIFGNNYNKKKMKFIQPNKPVCCDDVIKCVFDLNDLDIIIYKKLSKAGEVRADELGEELGKDRSTVYRSLQKLTCCGICIKQTKNIDKGGYYHTYKINNIKKTKERLEKCIDDWYKQMKQTLKNLEKN